MDFLINIMLPLLWFLMLLEWIYEKILFLICRLIGIQNPKQQRNNKGTGRGTSPRTTDKQRKNPTPERKAQADDGMNPQERTVPHITPEPAGQEPERKPLPKFKRNPPKVIIDLSPEPKKNDKQRQGMQL